MNDQAIANLAVDIIDPSLSDLINDQWIDIETHLGRAVDELSAALNAANRLHLGGRKRWKAEAVTRELSALLTRFRREVELILDGLDE